MKTTVEEYVWKPSRSERPLGNFFDFTVHGKVFASFSGGVSKTFAKINQTILSSKCVQPFCDEIHFRTSHKSYMNHPLFIIKKEIE
jgi:hypothetical protein